MNSQVTDDFLACFARLPDAVTRKKAAVPVL